MWKLKKSPDPKSPGPGKWVLANGWVASGPFQKSCSVIFIASLESGGSEFPQSNLSQMTSFQINIIVLQSFAFATLLIKWENMTNMKKFSS